MAASGGKGIKVPISALLIVGFGGLTLLAVGVSLFLGFSTATSSTRKLLEERSERMIDRVVGRIERSLDPVMRHSLWVAERVATGEIDPRRSIGRTLKNALAAAPAATGAALFDPDGQAQFMPAGVERPLSRDLSGQTHLMAAMAQFAEGKATAEPTWVEPVWNPILKKSMLALWTPLFREGRFKGMFAMIFTVGDLSHSLLQRRPLCLRSYV